MALPCLTRDAASCEPNESGNVSSSALVGAVSLWNLEHPVFRETSHTGSSFWQSYDSVRLPAQQKNRVGRAVAALLRLISRAPTNDGQPDRSCLATRDCCRATLPLAAAACAWRPPSWPLSSRKTQATESHTHTNRHGHKHKRLAAFAGHSKPLAGCPGISKGEASVCGIERARLPSS